MRLLLILPLLLVLGCKESLLEQQIRVAMNVLTSEHDAREGILVACPSRDTSPQCEVLYTSQNNLADAHTAYVRALDEAANADQWSRPQMQEAQRVLCQALRTYMTYAEDLGVMVHLPRRVTQTCFPGDEE